MAEVSQTAMFEKLLLSTDGSEFSEGAIREAINLAKRCSSKLYVISVIEVNPEFEALALQLVEKIERETRQHLESVKERASKEGVDCEIIVHQGEDACEYIIEEAAKRNVWMIIMGRRGRKGLKRVIMGSVTSRVIGHTLNNVLVVPRAARIKFNNILIATDGSIYSEAAALEAIGIAKLCESNLIAISVAKRNTDLPAAEESVEKVKQMAVKKGIKIEALTPMGVSFEIIVKTAKERNADLIIVGCYGRTGLERFLMGSVTERVIGLAMCAILVVPAKPTRRF